MQSSRMFGQDDDDAGEQQGRDGERGDSQELPQFSSWLI